MAAATAEAAAARSGGRVVVIAGTDEQLDPRAELCLLTLAESLPDPLPDALLWHIAPFLARPVRLVLPPGCFRGVLTDQGLGLRRRLGSEKRQPNDNGWEIAVACTDNPLRRDPSNGSLWLEVEVSAVEARWSGDLQIGVVSEPPTAGDPQYDVVEFPGDSPRFYWVATTDATLYRRHPLLGTEASGDDITQVSTESNPEENVRRWGVGDVLRFVCTEDGSVQLWLNGKLLWYTGAGLVPPSVRPLYGLVGLFGQTSAVTRFATV